MMSESLLYKLHSHEVNSDVEANPKYFKEVYKSKYGKVRIFQVLNVDEESKAWISDPRHKLCDEAPGDWFCRGQYPPALNSILAEKIDFNRQYQTEYFEKMERPKYPLAYDHIDATSDNAAISIIDEKQLDNQRGADGFKVKDEDAEGARIELLMSELKGKEATEDSIKEVSEKWEDTLLTTKMWNIIKFSKVETLESYLAKAPLLAYMRSSDGRGPMFWAFEHRRHDMVQVLASFGVGHNDRDKDGLSPVDLLDSQQ